jgi:c-di-GMP-binding flagellar brake protein YcgR
MSGTQRKEARLATMHLISYTRFAPENIPELMGVGSTVDLSQGGIRMTTREPLDEGEVLELEFAIDDQMVKADARVVHVQEVKHYVIGFQFEGLAPEEQEKIRHYLERHRPRPEGAAPGEDEL